VAMAVLMAGCGSSREARSTAPSSKVDAGTTAPSEPAVGEAVLDLGGDVGGAVYADGRVIWSIGDGDPGYLQRRLTPEGVERLRSRAVSTGLVEQHPTAWTLPRRMYVQPETSPFVPSRFMVGYDHGAPDWSKLPSPAREIVSSRLGGLARGDGCQVISTEQARKIARALTQAGIDVDYRSQRGLLGFNAGDGGSFVHSSPALPHEVAC
jgi:hypothetical protein